MQIWRYQSYTSQISPNALTWTTVAVHDERWRPVAHFDYTVNGKRFEQNEVFQGGLYRTPFAAELAIKEINISRPKVWYSPYDPSQATLEKFFPLKKLIYALIVLMLFIYGAWAGHYIVSERLRWKR